MLNLRDLTIDPKSLGAKLLLVERRGMTESEAHRRIEKAAMDGRTTRCEIALAILKEYGF